MVRRAIRILAWQALTLGVSSALAGVLWPGAAQQVMSQNPHGPLPTSLDCDACHTASGWTELRKPMDFDHAGSAHFPLDGRHAQVSCIGCHLDRRFDRPAIGASECASCHLDVHQGQLTGGCASCHNTLSFQPAADLYRHAATGFPLDGAHIRLTCGQCHGDDLHGLFAPLASDCIACHRPDFQRGHDEDAASFDTQCQRCHRTTGWRGSTLNHASFANGFALLGSHLTTACTSCHNPGDNSLLWPRPASDQDCVACHQSEYATAHSSAEFPSTCASCHNTNVWTGATFDHQQWFPIYRGKHAGTWQTCQQCHLVPNQYATFTCSSGGCHERSRTDRDHSEVNGYVFDPVQCLACHPRGDH